MYSVSPRTLPTLALLLLSLVGQAVASPVSAESCGHREAQRAGESSAPDEHRMPNDRGCDAPMTSCVLSSPCASGALPLRQRPIAVAAAIESTAAVSSSVFVPPCAEQQAPDPPPPRGRRVSPVA